ncbi:cyclin-dependent kinase 9 [Trichonephila inaurata madagascariensis]|uniref:Cyclin-dependent kinase 9 n=1 Tax=Trichonephila inaurata madagascariensis TaxID=2747483 RepID=A0A8X6WM44_9ARAC|nr:cyclin-dependent kinase 9 [Trichonephila inaurata madagascariensis]
MATNSTEKDTKASLEKLMEKLADADYPYCEEVSKYEKLAKIGQGTFGEVFKARHRNTRKIVALKKVLMENEKEGFPITALREIKILQLLKHENVVNLIEICRTKASAFNRSKSTFFLVFDFCEHDLAGLLSNVNVKFSLGEIKMVMKQLLNGLYFIHSNKILHRDMKAANILITKSGVLKLADFGLARAFSVSKNGQPNRYTNRVVTLWYRPPELLLGERNYGPPVDMWGAGCIMAEMWTRSPIMQGNTEQHQLTLISQLCGCINTDSFPGCDKLELYNKLELPKGQKRKVKERLKAYVKCPFALDLLDKLLTLDPSKRIDSDSALNHDFFWSDPLPSELTKMLSPHTQSMFEYLYSKKKDNARHQGGAGPHPRAHPTANDGQYHDRVF